MPTVRVYGVEGRAVPVRDSRGGLIMGRFIGLDRSGAPLPEGLEVEDGPSIWAAIARGDLTLSPPAAKTESPEAPAAPAPAAKRRSTEAP